MCTCVRRAELVKWNGYQSDFYLSLAVQQSYNTLYAIICRRHVYMQCVPQNSIRNYCYVSAFINETHTHPQYIVNLFPLTIVRIKMRAIVSHIERERESFHTASRIGQWPRASRLHFHLIFQLLRSTHDIFYDVISNLIGIFRCGDRIAADRLGRQRSTMELMGLRNTFYRKSPLAFPCIISQSFGSAGKEEIVSPEQANCCLNGRAGPVCRTEK